MTLAVCIPSSVVRETSNKREATRKLGLVARAAVVFRVDRLAVFPDRGAEGRWDAEFVATVLEYAATPPYLRKEVWDERDELDAVGVLPPLRVAGTGSGPESSESSREGIVTEVGPDGRVRVNCGLQHPISLVDPTDVGLDDPRADRLSRRDPDGHTLPLVDLHFRRGDERDRVLHAAIDPNAPIRADLGHESLS